MANKYSEEYKANYVEQVDKLRSEGMILPQALKAAEGNNHTPITYRAWKKKKKKSTSVVVHRASAPKRKYTRATTKKKVEKKEVEKIEESRVFMFVGSPKDVAQVMRSL